MPRSFATAIGIPSEMPQIGRPIPEEQDSGRFDEQPVESPSLMNCKLRPGQHSNLLTSSDIPDMMTRGVGHISFDLKRIFTPPGSRLECQGARLARPVVCCTPTSVLNPRQRSGLLTDDQVTIVIDQWCTHYEVGDIRDDLPPPTGVVS